MKPSNVPSIEMPRVKLSEVILLLLNRLNPGYMPSQKGDDEAYAAMDKTFWSLNENTIVYRPQYNSKPYYINDEWPVSPWLKEDECHRCEPEKKRFFTLSRMLNGYGLYTTSHSSSAMVAFISDGLFEIQVNLETRDAICRYVKDGYGDALWYPFTESIPLALNRFALEKAIENL